MARSRNIKPSFFKNEILGVADPILSLLFASLWTLADRDGRLEDRPLRIKAETFPYRDIPDFNGYLTQLEQHGFIDRYKVGELAIIQVVNFRKHQAPHNTEKASELPEKPIDSPITVKQQLKNDQLTQAKRSDSLNLIPDLLIPEPIIKPLVPSDAGRPSCQHEKIIELYHEILPTMPAVRVWTEVRKKKLAARWREDEKRQDLDFWQRFFTYVSKSDFLCGRTEKPFNCDLEWLVNASNFVKVIEGKYHA